MRIALLSDIHGNLFSLETALADVKRESPDRIFFLGDAATLGPRPVEVLELLRDIGCECVLGNHDEFMFRPETVTAYTAVKPIIDAIDWCRSLLTPENLDYLRSFARTLEIPLNPTTRLLCYHGSPASNTEVLLPGDAAGKLEGYSDDVRTIFAGGHTHQQMALQHRGNWIINAGSVGLPFGEFNDQRPPQILPFAEYALIDCRENSVEVRLKRLDIAMVSIKNELLRSGFPMKDAVLQQYSI